jgi:uncharacterized membrane protein
VVALGLLALEAAGSVMLIDGLSAGPLLGAFVARNAVPAQQRLSSIASLLAAALIVPGAALLYARASRRPSAAAWARISRAARVAAPLCVLWMLPQLLNMPAYDGRDLDFLLTASVFVLLVERCARTSLGALPARVTAAAPSRAARARRAPLVAAVAMAAGYVVLASLGSIRLHQKLLTSIYDLALFENLLFNTLRGVHGIALGFRYFAVHAELILYAILPVYWLVPRAETLLVLQSLFLGAAIVPLFLLARRFLRNGWQALGLVVAYALYPAVHGPNFYDFHFLTLSVPLVAWAAYFFVLRRWLPFWITVLFAMACREDVSLGLAVVGAALAFVGRDRRTSLALAAVGAIWFVSTKFVWMAQFGQQTFSEYYGGLVAPGERGFGSVLRTLLSNPLFVLSTMLTREKLITALHLLMPLAFLPIRQWRTVPLLLPGVLVLGLSTGSPAILQLSFQYVCHFTPYLFIAAAIAVAVRPRAQRWALIVAVLCGSVVASARFGALRYSHIASGFQTVSLAWSEGDAAHFREFAALAARIPAEASVSAGEHEGPHVARRPLLFTVKNGVQNADYVLFGLRSLRWGGRDAIVGALQSRAYGLVERRGDEVLLKRGAPTEHNAELIRWLLTAPIPFR